MNPNLFVAGVPKAGTTSLFHYLALHPDIFPSNRKEPGFFHPFKIKDMAANLEAYKKCFVGNKMSARQGCEEAQDNSKNNQTVEAKKGENT